MESSLVERMNREIFSSFQGSLNSLYVSRYCSEEIFRVRVEELISKFLKNIEIALDEFDNSYGDFDINEECKSVKFNSCYFSAYRFYYHVKFAIARNLSVMDIEDFVVLEDWISFTIWGLIRDIDNVLTNGGEVG